MNMKPRVLIVSGVIPATESGGGCMALHRHFCQRDDLEFAVASRNVTSDDIASKCPLPTPIYERIRPRRIFRRLRINLSYLRATAGIPRALLEFCERWRPDLIYSVADDLHATLGLQLAQHLRRPFVINFQDLFAISNFVPLRERPYRAIQPLLLRRYRHLQRSANWAFYTSRGMREWFGKDARGDILFPLGARPCVSPETPEPSRAGQRKVIYAGNCYGPYGEMVYRLAALLRNHPTIKFEVYSMGNDWNAEAAADLRAAGIHRGFVPFEKLELEMRTADAFLTVMSFSPDYRTFVETSFTTKWLDYSNFGRPVVVWAPSYSSAARFTEEVRAGISVDDPRAGEVVRSFERLFSDGKRWNAAAADTKRLASGAFDNDRIHKLFVDRVHELVKTNTGRVQDGRNDQTVHRENSLQ